MPMGGRPDSDGPDPPGPSEADRALAQMLEQWRRQDPEGYAAFVRGEPTRGPDGGPWPPPGPYSQGPSTRFRSRGVTALLVVVGLLLVVLVSPLPRWVLAVTDSLRGGLTVPGATSAGSPVTVVPPATGPGGRLAPAVPVGGAPPADEYAFLNTQPGSTAPVTWDPCLPVHYVVRDHGLGDAGTQLVHDAVAEVSAATGLVFVFDGMTDEAPTEERPVSIPARYGSGYAPVLVAWSDPQEAPSLDGDTAGLGGPVAVRTAGGQWTYVSGRVHLDTPQLEPDLGFLGRGQVEAVVMHELAHVVGADHPEDSSQLMAAEHRGQQGWEDGDRYALAVLGRGACGS
jgi:hypothetical protein